MPEELIAACQQVEMPAMALLDRDGVYGAPRFHLAAKRSGLKAHIGADRDSKLVHTVVVTAANVVNGTGSHRANTREELAAMVGPDVLGREHERAERDAGRRFFEE